MSQETLYQALFVQAKGQVKARLIGRLRTGRVRRVSRAERRAVIARSPVIPGMVMVTERPPEVADRAVPGHRAGDLLRGKGNSSAIATLVERASRYVILPRLPDDHSAERTAYALPAATSRRPALLKRSLTWDQGREMAQHAGVVRKLGLSSWRTGPPDAASCLLR